MANIKYKSKQIKDFYSRHRRQWKDFYPSERWVFERIYSGRRSLGRVLDIGCACAGLAEALKERFILRSYSGVDVNKEAIDWATAHIKLPIPVNFLSGDILRIKLTKRYETVISLSCADWNLETKRIIAGMWAKVARGGYLVVSLRLTTQKSVNNIKESFQYINFSGREAKPEIANYAVFNFRDALRVFGDLSPKPELIGCYGYYGKPSLTAVTPFKKLLFAVFYIKKGARINSKQNLKVEFNLPVEIFLNKDVRG